MNKLVILVATCVITSSLYADFFYKDKVKEISSEQKTIKIGNYNYGIFKGCDGWKVGDEIVFTDGMPRNKHCLKAKAVNLNAKENIVKENTQNTCILMCDIGKTEKDNYISLDYIIGKDNKK